MHWKPGRKSVQAWSLTLLIEQSYHMYRVRQKYFLHFSIIKLTICFQIRSVTIMAWTSAYRTFAVETLLKTGESDRKSTLQWVCSIRNSIIPTWHEMSSKRYPCNDYRFTCLWKKNSFQQQIRGGRWSKL